MNGLTNYQLERLENVLVSHFPSFLISPYGATNSSQSTYFSSFPEEHALGPLSLAMQRVSCTARIRIYSLLNFKS